jgi:hypothetical protein
VCHGLFGSILFRDLYLDAQKIILDRTSILPYTKYNNIDVCIQGMLMNIHDYVTAGGKNLIKEYISTRPMDERRDLPKAKRKSGKV